MPDKRILSKIIVNRKNSPNQDVKSHNSKARQGLSLIELLVVIAILGILASGISVAMVGHQKKARDAQRKNDMQTFKKAMEAANKDCVNAAYYPFRNFPSLGSEYSYFQIYSAIPTNQTGLLKELNYLNFELMDPKMNLSTLEPHYRLAGGPATYIATPPKKCPDLSGALNYEGMNFWVARAKLEVTADKDSAKSYNNCLPLIQRINAGGGTFFKFDSAYPPAANDGFFYVCGEV